MSKFDIILFDFDDTLWARDTSSESDYLLSRDNILLLNKLAKSNVCTVISGNAYDTIRKKIEKAFPEVVELCALSGNGLSVLEKKAEKLLCTGELDASEAILSTERQRKNAENALASVKEAASAVSCGVTLDAVNVCIDDAIGHLLELTGEKASDAVVDEVFSSFCVGK